MEAFDKMRDNMEGQYDKFGEKLGMDHDRGSESETSTAGGDTTPMHDPDDEAAMSESMSDFETADPTPNEPRFGETLDSDADFDTSRYGETDTALYEDDETTTSSLQDDMDDMDRGRL